MRHVSGNRHHLYALLSYLVLTLLMTFPLAREFGRAIPGDGFDGWQNVWNLWWVKRALLVDGSTPYFTRFVDYPDGVFLYFHTLNIFNGLTFLPFTLNGGTLVAYNVVVVFSFVVGGYGSYLLALYVIRQAPSYGQCLPRHARLGAFLGGAVFAYSPYHMAHLLGHLQLISLEWLPFYALFIMKVINRSASHKPDQLNGRLHRASIAALFLILAAACDWYYAFYLVLFTGLYLLWTIWRRRVLWKPMLAAATTGLFFVLISSPVLVPMVRESLSADYMVPPAGSTERLSADLTAFITPSELHSLWGQLALRWAGRFTATTSERTVFAGYSVLALGLVALTAPGRRARFWGLSALTFAVLALGPILHIGGNTRFAGIGPIPLPYALLDRIIPFLKISRSVSRFDVMVMLSLSVLTAVGLNWLLNRIQQTGYNGSAKWLTAVGALTLVGLEYWAVPYPMSAPETQPFHYQLAKESEHFAVMDIPMDWDRPANLLYQSIHQKPSVSGYTSRTNPLSPAWRTPVLQTFRYLGPDINADDPRTLAPTVLTALNVRYVIIHKTDLPPGDYRETTLELADAIFDGWPVIVDDDWLKVFRVTRPNTSLAYVVLGEGWAPRDWRNGGPVRVLSEPEAQLRLQLPGPLTAHVEIGAHSLDEVATLEIHIGEELIDSHVVNRPATIINTPRLLLPAGESVIRIRTDAAPGKVAFTRVNLVVDD